MLCYTRFQSFLQDPEPPASPVSLSTLARDCAESLPVAELLELVEDGDPVVFDIQAASQNLDVLANDVVQDILVNRAVDDDEPPRMPAPLPDADKRWHFRLRVANLLY